MNEYDPTKCLKSIHDTLGDKAKACENLKGSGLPYHCDSLYGISPKFQDFCKAHANHFYAPLPVYYCEKGDGEDYKYEAPEKILADCNALQKKDPSWHLSLCYCCCACAANSTKVVMAEGEKAIGDIQVGEKVEAGALKPGGELEWSPTQVQFSQGTGAGGEQPTMVYFAFGPESSKEMICTMDQPLLLANGKFTTAGKLRVGQQLAGRDGSPVAVHLVSLGSYTGGVHHISTATTWEGNADSHLLVASGVVVGDWTLQMHFDGLPEDQKEEEYETLPIIGSSDYESRYGDNLEKSDIVFEFSAKGTPPLSQGRGNLRIGSFKAYYREEGYIPPDAQGLVTRQQALDIMRNGEQSSIGDSVPKSIFNTIAAQLAGFFPDIDFHYDSASMLPNVYAFEAYGKKVVQVNGGFARIKHIGYEGLLMAMAHGAACFHGGDPKNAEGYTAVGQADSFAFGVTSRLCWFGPPALQYTLDAFQSWSNIFALVDPSNAEGTDPIENPSLSCRLRSIESAIAGGPLLECAGGRPLPKVQLEQATRAETGGVDIVFSIALTKESAENVENYTFKPSAPVNSVKMDSTGFKVHVDVELKDIDYQITVANLISIVGSGLDPDDCSAEVEYSGATVE